MSLELDRGRAAVVVIECQNDLIHESNLGQRGIGGALAKAITERRVLERMNLVLSAARASAVPVLYANKESKPGVPTGDAPIYHMTRGRKILAEGSWGAEVHDAIAPQPGDVVLRRFLSIDASYGSGLYGTLHAMRRDTIVAMGVSTNFAVEGTVRGAVNRSFRVVVPADCCASAPLEMHEFSVRRILPLLATVTTAEEVAAALRGQGTT